MCKRLVGLLSFLCSNLLWADTYLGGELSGEWTLSQSPYIVTEDSVVASNTTLVIEPGVEVRFSEGRSLTVYGTLSAVGTPTGTITFTGSTTSPSPGFWRGITFSGNANGSISFCNIGYCKQAIYLNGVSEIEVTHSLIHNNKGDDGVGGIGCGVYLSSSENNTISENTILNNSGGRGRDNSGWSESGGVGGVGAGIYLSSSNNNRITLNTIKHSYGGSGGEGGEAGSGGEGGVGCGIYILSSEQNFIGSNTISEQYGGTGSTGGIYSSGGAGGIGCGVYLDSSVNNTITATEIEKSAGGAGGLGGIYGSNGISNLGYGIYLNRDSLQNSLSDNTYNDEPVHYYYNLTNLTIKNETLTVSCTTNYGRITAVSCRGGLIEGCRISGGKGEDGSTGVCYGRGEDGGAGAGIWLIDTENLKIKDNTIFGNTGGRGGVGGAGGSGGAGGFGCGICLESSKNNEVSGNHISQNKGGGGGMGGINGSGGRGGIGSGIRLTGSSLDNIIEANTIENSTGGEGGPESMLGADGADGIGYGVYLEADSLNNQLSLNRYNGERLHYYYGETAETVIENETLTVSCTTNYGRITLIRCSNFVVKNICITANIGEPGHTGDHSEEGEQGGIGSGIYLYRSSSCRIIDSTIKGIVGGAGGAGGRFGDGGRGGTSAAISIIDSENISIEKNTLSENRGGRGGKGGIDSRGGKGGAGCGVYILSSAPSILRNRITDNRGGERGEAGPHSGTEGEEGDGFGIHTSSSARINLNDILSNKSYGVYNSSSSVVDARYNFWGDLTGPYHPEKNPTGKGDRVSDCVEFMPYNRSIHPSPGSGCVGVVVTLYGAGFSEPVTIHFGTHIAITTAIPTDSGTFSSVFTVDTQPGGTRIITLETQSLCVTTPFIILANLFLAKEMGCIGDRVEILGAGMGQKELLRIDFGTHLTIATCRSSESGTFSTSFCLSSQPSGRKRVTVYGIWTVGADFYLQGFIEIEHISPRSGPIGTDITLRGSTSEIERIVTISFGRREAISTTTSSASGTFSVEFRVDDQERGSKTITASVGSYLATSTFLMTGAVIELVKEFEIEGPFGGTSSVPGATITYTITIKNVGDSASADTYLIDRVPLYTQYATGTLRMGGLSSDYQTATHMTDQDDGDGARYSDGRVIFDIGRVEIGEGGKCYFKVYLK